MLDRPVPANDSASARDIAYHLHPYTNMRRLESEGPFVITRGNGIRVTDDAGREYIDAMAGLWCTSLGFSEKRLADAAYKQMLELPYTSTFGQRSHPTVIELAERLISLTPVPMSKVFFNNSGSEANDTAVEAGLVLQQCHRPAAQEEDHLADEGLSRRHVGCGEPVRSAVQSTRISTCRSPIFAIPTARISTATASRGRPRRISPPAWRRTSTR